MLVLFITANYLTPIFQLPRSSTIKLNKTVNINVSQVGLREYDQRLEYFIVHSWQYARQPWLLKWCVNTAVEDMDMIHTLKSNIMGFF
jgi:hypothetical protein